MPGQEVERTVLAILEERIGFRAGRAVDVGLELPTGRIRSRPILHGLDASSQRGQLRCIEAVDVTPDGLTDGETPFTDDQEHDSDGQKR